jgi:hypothetical protein
VHTYAILFLLGAASSFAAPALIYSSNPTRSSLGGSLVSLCPPIFFGFVGYTELAAGTLVAGSPALLCSLFFVWQAWRYLTAWLEGRQSGFKRDTGRLRTLKGEFVLGKPVKAEFVSIMLAHGRYLPENDPVAWREEIRDPLDTRGRRRLRMVVVEGLLLLLARFSLAEGWLLFEPFVAAFYVLLAVTALWIVARYTALFAQDRAKQNLAVLLSTPMSGWDIVRQKARGAWRRWTLLVVVIATIAVIASLHAGAEGDSTEWRSGAHILLEGVNAVMGLALLTWFSLWMGLKLRSRLRAALLVLAAAAWWYLWPMCFEDACRGFTLAWLSPPGLLRGIVAGLGEITATWLPRWADLIESVVRIATPVANWLLCGAVIGLIRWRCVVKADRYLGRIEAPARPRVAAAGGSTA